MDFLDENTNKALLVEGMSDVGAVETLARRLGRDLTSEGIALVSVFGATNFGHFLQRLGPRGLDIEVGGLIDAAEKDLLMRGLTRTGFGQCSSDEDLNRLGFFICDADLEDEMIRALGTAAVLDVVERLDELHAFRSMQRQPAWRDKPLHAQLQRFIGVKSGRKVRYGNLLADAVDLDRMPPPLRALLSS